jgi:hypothetical protein
LPAKNADRDVRVPREYKKTGSLMNRLILLILLLSALCMINAKTLEVSLDGTQPYASSNLLLTLQLIEI